MENGLVAALLCVRSIRTGEASSGLGPIQILANTAYCLIMK